MFCGAVKGVASARMPCDLDPMLRVSYTGHSMFRSNRQTRRPRRTTGLLLAGSMALTLLLRVWFILGMRNQPFSTIGPQMVDPYFYHRWALDILHGNFLGNDVFFLRPLYPYLLAGVYAVFGPHVLAVQLLQALLSAISCLLLFLVTRRFFDITAASIAAVAYALTGILVFYTGTLLYVEITVLLSLLSVWLVLVAGRRTWVWLLAGLSLGTLVICRPELLAVLPFMLLWLWRRKTSGRHLLVLTATTLLTVATVPVRNYLVARDPVLFTAHSGINFYYGNNPAADGTWQPTAELERGVGFSHQRLKRVSRTIDGKELKWSQASAFWTRKAIAYIIGHPGGYVKLLGRKFLLFLSNYEVPNDYYPETGRFFSLPLKLAFVNYALLLALASAGMIWAWPRRREALLPYLFVGAYLLSSLLFYVLSRLRAPVMPFLMMFAGFAVSELLTAVRQRKMTRIVAGVALAVAVYAGSCLISTPKSRYSAEAWTQTGTIYLGQRKMAPAIESFRKALAAQPAHYMARYNLVQSLAGMGRYPEAQAEYRELILTAPRSEEGRMVTDLATARVAVARRDFALAASLYRSVLQKDPSDSETCYLLGLVYISMDSLASAAEWLRRSTSLDPGNEAAASALKAVESRLR
jgi:4-amino-4-deoxy-L-arabinose transferase-like glycosyltransferase